MRGGALDINVKPDEGTTVTLRLAAAFGSSMETTEPFDFSPILAQPGHFNTGVISGTTKQ